MKNLIATILLIGILSFTTDKPDNTKSLNDEKVYTLKYTGEQLAIIYNGLKKSTAPFNEIEYALAITDAQVQAQLKADSTKKK
jgi:hypothetical protein